MTRPGLDPPDGLARPLEQLLEDRWSCRAFLPQQVQRAVIERMLALAQQAPSWCNTQPWQAVVTSGAATKRLRAGLVSHVRAGHAPEPDFPAPDTYQGVYRERRRSSGWQLYEAVGVRRGDRHASAQQVLRNFELFDAPHVAVLTTDASQGVYGAVDTGVYLGTLLLAATSLGISTVAQAALAMHASFIREFLSIPDDRRVLVAVSFGYPDRNHPANSYRTPRAHLGEVVTWADD